MDYYIKSMVFAVDVAVSRYGADTSLLAIAKKQNAVMLSGAGLKTAKALFQLQNDAQFAYKSISLNDGPNGDEGGLSIMRENTSKSLLLFKYTAHGLSHGHYDKLGFMYYHDGNPIIPDYGAARWVGTEPKYGGRYLPENKSYAMTSVAHNVLVVDEKSHFNGMIAESSKYHPNLCFADIVNPEFQIVSAEDSHAYPGVVMRRTMCLIKDTALSDPVIVDVIKAQSETEHQYDLPFYYYGHLMSTNFKYHSNSSALQCLGAKNGYQHLWNVAEAPAPEGSRITFLNGNHFYSIVSSTDTSMKIAFTLIGANDPDFDLRNDPGIMFRKKGKSFVLASAIEVHGNYNGHSENSSGETGRIKSVQVLGNSDEGVVVEIRGKDNALWTICIAEKQGDEVPHEIRILDKIFSWKGNYHLYTSDKKD